MEELTANKTRFKAAMFFVLTRESLEIYTMKVNQQITLTWWGGGGGVGGSGEPLLMFGGSMALEFQNLYHSLFQTKMYHKKPIIDITIFKPYLQILLTPMPY